MIGVYVSGVVIVVVVVDGGGGGGVYSTYCPLSYFVVDWYSGKSSSISKKAS